MDSEESEALPDLRAQQRRVEMKRRVRNAATIIAVLLAIDTYLSVWLIPWVSRQDWAITHHGNVGYVIFFFMILFTFLTLIALVAYLLSRSSYPADNWQ